MRKNEVGKIGAIGIVLIFVFGAFAPAIGSGNNTTSDPQPSTMIVTGNEESLTDIQAHATTTGDTKTSLWESLGYMSTIVADIVLENALLNWFSTFTHKNTDTAVSDTKNTPDDSFIQTSESTDSCNCDEASSLFDNGLDEVSDHSVNSIINNREKNQNNNINLPSQLRPLDPSDPWWNTSWQYRKEITINHTKVASNFTNFPVLISLGSDADLASKAQADADDLVFTDKNGNKLHHEIELYNGSTGKLVCWVNVTSLSSMIDTKIWMYYGNSSCSSQQNVHETWNSNYVGVWHLNETSSPSLDSTSNNNDGTPCGSPTYSATGIIDGAVSFDGTDDWIEVNTDESLNLTDTLTLEVWGKSDNALVNTDTYLAKRVSGTTNTNYMIQYEDGLQFYIYDGSAWRSKQWGSAPAAGVWAYLAVSFDESNARVYYNGTLDNANTAMAYNLVSNAGEFRIATGNPASGAPHAFDGTLDEVRISNIVRNASWISTTHNTINSPSTFYCVGNEQEVPDTIPPEITNVVDSPDPQEVGEYVNITCDVTDNVAVDEVRVNITYPDSSYCNETMIGNYYYNTTYEQIGTYHYFIWANDTSENTNISSNYTFEIIQQPDITPPQVEITTPQKGFLYINLADIVIMKIPFITTLIIGKITVTANATDNQSGINRVEFYVDNELKATDTTAPYNWTWSERGHFFPYTLKVIAYDDAENKNSAEVKVWKIF